MGSTNEYDVRHNKATALLNLMNLHPEKFQSIQDFRDQYLAMKKVCDVLDLRIGRCETDAKDVLKKKNVTNPTDAQLNKAMDQVEEELHAIIFMYLTGTNTAIYLTRWKMTYYRRKILFQRQ